MKSPLPHRFLWILLPGAALLLLLLAGAVFAWINASGSADAPLADRFQSGTPGTKTLIVLVHGYSTAGKMESMEAVKEAALRVQPGADVVFFGYAAQLFSNANPFSLAEEMNSKLEQLQAEHNYDRVILCGFSMGALLIRKAYVYGCGSVADSPRAESRATAVARAKWVDHVDRFVLLAGMNRGFSPNAVPENSSAFMLFSRRVGIALAKFTGTGRLPRQCMRGAPFVANLRLQWLEVMRDARQNNRQRPKAIQLLGLKDDVVGQTDSRDITVARDFIWVPVNNTSHADIVRLGDTGSALERRRKVELAFGNEETLAELQRVSPVTNLEQDNDVKTVVFVLHGIRDMGEWTSQFTIPLQEKFAQQNPAQNGQAPPKLHIHAASYGYFGMLPFLLFADRQENVRWFVDEMTDLMARFPNVQEIHFIGHSYGTYIVASALEQYRALKINRVALAGCVLRRDYKWNLLTGRVGAIRHYVGADDWVVGLLPKLFELPLFNVFNKDIGGAGFDGFTDSDVRALETYFVWGGHSGALAPDNVKSIVAFISSGEKIDVPERKRDGHPPKLAVLSNICWILWILAVGLLVTVGWLLPRLIRPVARLFRRKSSFSSPAFVWICRAAYVVVLLLLLRTI